METTIIKETTGVNKTIHFGAPRVTKMRKFPCEICYKLFTKNFLKVHFEAVHRDKNYKCSICNKEYMEERGLKQHVDSMHEGKKITNVICVINPLLERIACKDTKI